MDLGAIRPPDFCLQASVDSVQITDLMNLDDGSPVHAATGAQPAAVSGHASGSCESVAKPVLPADNIVTSSRVKLDAGLSLVLAQRLELEFIILLLK